MWLMLGSLIQWDVRISSSQWWLVRLMTIGMWSTLHSWKECTPSTYSSLENQSHRVHIQSTSRMVKMQIFPYKSRKIVSFVFHLLDGCSLLIVSLYCRYILFEIQLLQSCVINLQDMHWSLVVYNVFEE